MKKKPIDDTIVTNKYRRATDEEIKEYGCDECYDLLVGPNGFECLLTEPEDRVWWRDGKKVVEELNCLLDENSRLKESNKIFEKNSENAALQQLMLYRIKDKSKSHEDAVQMAYRGIIGEFDPDDRKLFDLGEDHGSK